MITAKEAKRIADNFHENKIERQKKYIKEQIEKAAMDGNYAINLDDIATVEIIDWLKSNGFEVSVNTFRNETVTYIRWFKV